MSSDETGFGDQVIDPSKNGEFKEFITKEGFVYILPKLYKNFFIDGFFAARLVKNG